MSNNGNGVDFGRMTSTSTEASPSPSARARFAAQWSALRSGLRDARVLGEREALGALYPDAWRVYRSLCDEHLSAVALYLNGKQLAGAF